MLQNSAELSSLCCNETFLLSALKNLQEESSVKEESSVTERTKTRYTRMLGCRKVREVAIMDVPHALEPHTFPILSDCHPNS